MNIQWFPGHMTKAVRMMEQNIELCNVLIYVIDARAVTSSKNPIFDKFVQNKEVVYVFNKCDLVEKSDLDKWVKLFEKEGKTCVRAVGTSGDCSQIVSSIKFVMRDMIEHYRKKGANRSIRVMVVGVPNSGKSTLINSMRKKASAATGNRPGVTRGKQWLSLDKYIDLLDTPGTLWGKFENQTIAKHLAFIGSIRDEILDLADLAFEFVKEISHFYSQNIKTRYSLESLSESPLEILQQIGNARGFKMRGGELDYDRTGRTILDDFRKGRLGKIMLEKIEDEYNFLTIKSKE